MSVEVNNSVRAPASLDEKFFLDTLEDVLLETNVKLKRISFEMGSASGDNYCSQIYRVRLGFQCGSGSIQSMTVIVKSVPVSENTQFLDDLGAFVKERTFYSKVLPRMEFLLDNVRFGPKLYHSLKEPINTLVFEDLASLNYVMTNREVGLDFEHSQLVMRKLGQFHAISMVLYKKDPDCMNAFSSGFLSAKAVNGSDTFATLFGNNLQGVIDLATTWKGYETITEKLKRYKANLKENLIKIQLPIAGEVKVLNHGDLWVNNCLFRYSKAMPSLVEDMVFLDFQMSFFGSPGFDLNYFMYTSLRLDILKERRDDLLRVYHAGMVEVLLAYGYQVVPSFRDIVAEVRRREPYGFFANFGVLPGATLEKASSGDSNIDNFMDTEFAKNKIKIMFSGKRLQETLRYTLKRFDEMDIWD